MREPGGRRSAVPNKVVDPLLVLVAPSENEDIFSGKIIAMMPRSEESPAQIELWEFNDTSREEKFKVISPTTNRYHLIGSDSKDVLKPEACSVW
jgi:hypothetical protein